MKKTVVLYPGLAVSHFVPMMRLADVFLKKGYAVTVVLIDDPTLKQDIVHGVVIDRVASSKPSVTFHTLPKISDPPAISFDVQFILGYFELIGRYTRHLHDFLRSMPPGSVHALVMDMFSIEALDVAKKLRIPAYSFYPSNASGLAASIQFSSTREDGQQQNFGELGDTPLNLHGVPPVPASHLCHEMLESPESGMYKSMASMMRRIQEADGILVNSFESLEPRAMSTLRDLNCCPMGAPVYCIGPLVSGGDGETGERRHECLAWLDEQSDRSVVFLCFGSCGVSSHSEKQLKEIAVGLEKSGHRFLWVVRAPPHHDPEKPFNTGADPDIDVLLPEGFLERTNGRGLVVKLWAPQVDVLNHRATGAFVTHCGWNSVLEGIMAGVPMLCWPLYAEQKMNKVFLVEEFGIGVELEGWQHGLVTAEQVETKVRLVMQSEEGERLRARVAEHREAAAMAWKDGGSSHASFSQFLSDMGKLVKNVRIPDPPIHHVGPSIDASGN